MIYDNKLQLKLRVNLLFVGFLTGVATFICCSYSRTFLKKQKS
jgi:hypothetical protein